MCCLLASCKGSRSPAIRFPTCMLDPNAQALLTAGGKYGGIFPAPQLQRKPTFHGRQYRAHERTGRNRPHRSRTSTISSRSMATSWQNRSRRTTATTMWSGDNVPSIANTFGNPSYAAVIHTAYTISPNVGERGGFQLQREPHRTSCHWAWYSSAASPRPVISRTP